MAFTNKTPSVDPINLIGATEDAAELLLITNQETYRVSRRDENYYVLTRDMNPSRYNLSIEGGIVVKVTMG